MIPTSYQSAKIYLNGRDSKNVRSVRSTKVCKIDNGYALRYHGTNVVTWLDNGKTIISNGGYQTFTTKKRINEAIVCIGFVFQKNYEWFFSRNTTIDPEPFIDGMNIS